MDQPSTCSDEHALSVAKDEGRLPYRIAVLCYLYDGDGHVLLVHRKQNPNIGMYSPVGGKLDIASGEGPHGCAIRELKEETGIELAADQLRLLGVVSERAYEDQGHWLIFLFEATVPIRREKLKWVEFKEGRLEWKRVDEVPSLPIPRTDREVMWPQVRAHLGGFFAVHIDWTKEGITWTLYESIKPKTTGS
jgi:8-oxo-dGTP diphosphatase